MNKLFKFFMFFTIPLLSVLVVSCKDDEDPPVIPSPTITAVNPTEGPVGTTVTITGTNLSNADVRFGTFDATVSNNTATSITTTVPTGATAGAQNITVTTAGGTATSNFTVTEEAAEAPTITSFEPVSGAVGTTVIITGTNLDQATGATIGDVEIADWVVTEDGTIATFTIPEGAATGTFNLANEAGDDVVSAEEFTVTYATITSFDPTTAAVGDTVTVTGINLNQVDTAMIGDVGVANWQAAEDGTTATFTVPEGATTGTITITNEAGEEVVSAEELTVGEAEPFATITSFDPMVGDVGQEVTVTGTNLNLVDTAMIGDVGIADWQAAEDGTTATFTIPEGAVSGNITIANEAGDEVVSEDAFTVGATTTVITFDPMAGPEGTTVTLSGGDFTGVTSVMLGETEITDVTVSDDGTTLTFDIPAGATTGFISVGDGMASAEEFAVGTANMAFADALGEGWVIWDGWGGTTSDPANTDLEGTTAIRVNYTSAWAGFQLHPEPPIELTGDEAIVLSIYGAEGAGDVMVYVKDATDPTDADKVTLDVVEGEWRTFVIPVSEFTNNPARLNELVIQNRDVATSTIYVDDVMLIQ